MILFFCQVLVELVYLVLIMLNNNFRDVLVRLIMRSLFLAEIRFTISIFNIKEQ